MRARPRGRSGRIYQRRFGLIRAGKGVDAKRGKKRRERSSVGGRGASDGVRPRRRVRDRVGPSRAGAGDVCQPARGCARPSWCASRRCVYWLSTRSGLVSHETHLSAEKAQASAHTRFPRADAHARRQAHAQASPQQGPQAPHRVMSGSAAARPRLGRGRLSRSADFDRVFRNGRSYAGRELVLHVFPRGEEGPTRLGLSVSRKVGGAVERNRVKRLLREAFALESARLPPATDVVIVARPDAKGLAEREGLAGIRRVLSDLIDRATGERARSGADRADRADRVDGAVRADRADGADGPSRAPEAAA